jgi:DnaJ-like protein
VDKQSDFWSLVEVSQSPGAEGICAAPGCDSEASHRAPVSRRNLKNFIWLCLDHVRAYNAAWDYYAGFSEAEIEAHRRADATWRRPSWPLGANGAYPANADGPEIRDDFGVYENAHAAGGPRNGSDANPWKPVTEDQRALAVLDLAPPVNKDQVRIRYKELVKRLHPDANGGDKKAEERLKLVNDAYSTLKRGDWLQSGPR